MVAHQGAARSWQTRAEMADSAHHLSQDPDSISQTFLEQFAPVLFTPSLLSTKFYKICMIHNNKLQNLIPNHNLQRSCVEFSKSCPEHKFGKMFFGGKISKTFEKKESRTAVCHFFLFCRFFNLPKKLSQRLCFEYGTCANSFSAAWFDKPWQETTTSGAATTIPARKKPATT